MSMSALWGTDDPQQSSYENPFSDGDLVELRIIGRNYPTSYLKEWEKEQDAENIAAREMGLTPKQIPMSFKKGGISYGFVIVKHFRQDTQEWVDVVDFYKPIKESIPKYSIFNSIYQFPPQVIYDKKLADIKGGYFNSDMTPKYNKDGSKQIGALLPNPYPASKWENGRKILDASDIKTKADIKTPDHQEVFDQEVSRADKWRIVLNSFAGKSEEEATKQLHLLLAGRYIITTVIDGVEYYTPPTEGLRLMLKVKITKSANGKDFMSFIATEWDKNLRTNLVYNKPTELPTEDEINLAMRWNRLRSEIAVEREKAREEKNKEKKEVDVEEEDDSFEPEKSGW